MIPNRSKSVSKTNFEWGPSAPQREFLPKSSESLSGANQAKLLRNFRSKAFGRYEDLFTLNTNIADYQKTIGQRDQLSFNDIRLMNVIYCSDACPKQLPCQRGGYTDPRRCDRCRCPDGFTGQVLFLIIWPFTKIYFV